jgi:hypothetical protein
MQIMKKLNLTAALLLTLVGIASGQELSDAGPIGMNDAFPEIRFAALPGLFQTGEAEFRTEHIWDAHVTIGDMIVLGTSKYGHRRIIPITGGIFEGPAIKGVVLPHGEDWQLTRPDGDTELYARYLLKTDDDFLIQVTNRVLIHPPEEGEGISPYIRSVIDLEAPVDSPYEYLNHAIFLGTLTQPELKPGEDPYVIIGVYRVL